MERVLGMRLEVKPASVGSFASNLRSFKSVRDFIASATVSALIDFPFAHFLVVILWISWPLVLIPVLGLALGPIYAYIIQHKMHQPSEMTYRASSMRNATLVESLTALETIIDQGAEGVVQNKAGIRRPPSCRVPMPSTRPLSASASNGRHDLNWLRTAHRGRVYLIEARMLSMGGLIAVTMLGGRAIAPLAQAVGLLNAVPERAPFARNAG